MNVEYFTLGMQFVILVIVGWNMGTAHMVSRNARQVAELIRGYRREIEWLTARIETLEAASKKTT